MKFRGYQSAEFAFGCKLRGLDLSDSPPELTARLEKSGAWNGHYLDYVIEVAGELIGEVQLRHCDQTMPAGVVEFGLEISPEFQGKGYGTQTTTAITKLILGKEFHRISGSTDAQNLAMQKVFEKSGWTREGTLHALFVEDGKPRDFVSYYASIYN